MFGQHQGSSFVHGVAVHSQEQSWLHLGCDDVKAHSLVDESPKLIGRLAFGAFLHYGSAWLRFSSLDSETHFTSNTNDQIVVLSINFEESPALVTPAVQSVLNEFGGWLQGGTWDVEV